MFRKYSFLLLLLSLLTACNQDQINQLLYKNNKAEKAKQEAQLKAKQDSIVQAKVQQALQQQLKDLTPITKPFTTKNSKQFSEYLKTVYTESDITLGWQNELARTPLPVLTNYKKAVEQAPSHGLKTSDYWTKDIAQLHQQLYGQVDSLQSTITDTTKYAQQIAQLDYALSASFLAYTSDLLLGRLTPRKYQWVISQRKRDFPKLLKEVIQSGNVEKAIAAVIPPHKGYTALQKKLASYQNVAKNGGWKKIDGKAKLSKGKASDDVTALAKRLAQMGDLPSTYLNKSGAINFDDAITKGLKNYQKRHQISATGGMNKRTRETLNVPVKDRIAAMELTMERYRWLPDHLGDKYIWVNIPEYQVYVVENQDTIADIVAVVGALATPTPILVDKPLQDVILSPTWTVPMSITNEEMEYIRANPAVLITSDVDVFLDGKKIDPRKINWHTTKMSRVKLRQRPKKKNAMGQAKFMFANNHSIYLHDTPFRDAFSRSKRVESHGCVRVKEPALLAQKLLQGKKGWTMGRIKSAMNSGKEQYIKPSRKTRVHIFYLTTWVDDKGNLQFRNDVYGRTKRQLKALQEL